MSKFKLKPRATGESAEPPASLDQFIAGAAMVQTQTEGRPLKPVRINFDLDPAMHHRLRQRARDRGLSAANLIRQLIVNELSK